MADDPRPDPPTPPPPQYGYRAEKFSPLISTRTGGEVVGELPPPKTYSKLTPEEKQARLGIIVAMRITGRSTKEIAEALGVAPTTVRDYLYAARKDGTLRETAELLDHKFVPDAIDNLGEFLHSLDPEIRQKATYETLHGRGVLRSFANQKRDGEGVDLPVLTVTVEPAGRGEGMPAVVVNSDEGAIVGTPKA